MGGIKAVYKSKKKFFRDLKCTEIQKYVQSVISKIDSFKVPSSDPKRGFQNSVLYCL